jgi:hypothetical protein
LSILGQHPASSATWLEPVYVSLNQRVPGSSPGAPTNHSKDLVLNWAIRSCCDLFAEHGEHTKAYHRAESVRQSFQRRGRSSFYGCTDVRDRRAAGFDSTIRRFESSRASQRLALLIKHFANLAVFHSERSSHRHSECLFVIRSRSGIVHKALEASLTGHPSGRRGFPEPTQGARD